MSQSASRAGAGVRRAWVIFSGLSFALCAALLFAQLERRHQPAESTVQRSPGAATQPPLLQAPPTAARAPALPQDERAASRIGAAKHEDGAAAEAAKETRGAFAADGKHQPSDKKARVRDLDDVKSVADRPAKQVKSDEAGGPDRPNGPTPAPGDKPPPPTPAAGEALASSVLKVNVPAKMIVGQSEHLRAVIGTRANTDLVAQEVALGSDAGHPQVQIGRNLMLSKLVRMDLRSDSASDFDISPKHPAADQLLTDNDVTIWEWAVTPKLEGLRHLTLTVSNLRESNHELLQTKIYPVNIAVEVTAFQRVRELAVAGSSVLSALAGLVGAWLGILRPLLQRRRPDGEGDAGAARPRTSGNAPPGPQPPRPEPAPQPTPPRPAASPADGAPSGEPAGGPEHQFTD